MSLDCLLNSKELPLFHFLINLNSPTFLNNTFSKQTGKLLPLEWTCVDSALIASSEEVIKYLLLYQCCVYRIVTAIRKGYLPTKNRFTWNSFIYAQQVPNSNQQNFRWCLWKQSLQGKYIEIHSVSSIIFYMHREWRVIHEEIILKRETIWWYWSWRDNSKAYCHKWMRERHHQ